MPYKETPATLRGLWLAEQMRHMRKERGITLKIAASRLGKDHSGLARMEKARWPFVAGRVRELLDLYHEFDARRRANLLKLDKEAQRVDAWDPDPGFGHSLDDHPNHMKEPSDPANRRTTVPFPERHQPTLRGHWLGQQMRELRISRGATLEEVARRMSIEFSSLARYERGELKFKYDDVAALLDLYHVFDDRERDLLLSLTLDIRQANNWDVDFTDELPHQPFVNLGWLESRASRICVYATGRIPDLLQTPEYAEHLTQQQIGTQKPTLALRAAVEALTKRQEAFHAGTTPLSLVIAEAALGNQVGDKPVMDRQLAYLDRLRANKRFTIRVLPAGHPMSARYDTAFHVFEMPDPYPPVAVTQSLAGRLYLEKPRSLRFVVAYDHLHTAALPQTDTHTLLANPQRETPRATMSDQPDSRPRTAGPTRATQRQPAQPAGPRQNR